MTEPLQPPLTQSRAQRELRAYLSSRLKLILPKDTTVARMSDLLGSQAIKGGKIFDFFLAATMLDNGVGTIYTENVRDFAGIAGIEAINPWL